MAERQRGVLLAILAPFVTLAAVQFLLRYAGERRRWVDVGLPAQCAVMPLTLMVLGAAASARDGQLLVRGAGGRGWRGIAAVPAQDVALRAVNNSGRWPRWAP